jgi:hypothetical protein
MKWYRPLYMGALAKKNKREIIRKIKSRKFMATACFICLALNEEELLEIYPVYTLVNKRFPVDDLYIVGIAANRFEAFRLVTKIVDDVYQKTGTVDVRGYFKS